ncbi:hypothetical protein [Blastopirellula marina]|uniref:Uncharacterized protein n=1 Tax=Blastopirellula marina TaxID=124 RepID=A0A2S8GCW1_9BACT|nr:hypothetical protein [Blastopirellula marina]PQO42287.1 hypothetical protein C5Y93_28515 [Blastopirellula marina]
MRTPTLAFATTVLLATASLASADPKEEAAAAPPQDITPAVPLQEAVPAMEIEKIRQQLGPEFSIESEELDISFDRVKETAETRAHAPVAGPHGSNNMDNELRELAEGTRQQARHLEELAARAEVEMQYTLADNLRELARQKWQIARILAVGSDDLTKPVALPGSQVTLPTPYASTTPPPASFTPIISAPGTIFPASLTAPAVR